MVRKPSVCRTSFQQLEQITSQGIKSESERPKDLWKITECVCMCVRRVCVLEGERSEEGTHGAALRARKQMRSRKREAEQCRRKLGMFHKYMRADETSRIGGM